MFQDQTERVNKDKVKYQNQISKMFVGTLKITHSCLLAPKTKYKLGSQDGSLS